METIRLEGMAAPNSAISPKIGYSVYFLPTALPKNKNKKVKKEHKKFQCHSQKLRVWRTWEPVERVSTKGHDAESRFEKIGLGEYMPGFRAWYYTHRVPSKMDKGT